MVDLEIAPEVAVMVTCEVPLGVVVGPVAALPPEPQPATLAATAAATIAIGSNDRNLRLLVNMPSNARAASGTMAAAAIPIPVCLRGVDCLAM